MRVLNWERGQVAKWSDEAKCSVKGPGGKGVTEIRSRVRGSKVAR